MQQEILTAEQQTKQNQATVLVKSGLGKLHEMYDADPHRAFAFLQETFSAVDAEGRNLIVDECKRLVQVVNAKNVGYSEVLVKEDEAAMANCIALDKLATEVRNWALLKAAADVGRPMPKDAVSNSSFVPA